METVTLGFKAYDIHELACHFVARQAGLYRRHGLEVRLTDTSFIPDERLPARTFSAACGAALTAWLGGADSRVVFVAAERPMFWFYGRAGVRELSALEGELVASYPPQAPPAILLRAILRRYSLGPERVGTLAVRDDVARIGLLRDGSAAGAVVSSAVAPQSLRDRGLAELLSFGNEIRLPTTGLAIDASTLAAEPDLVAAMCRCYREALALIHDEAGVLEAALADFVTVIGAEQAVMAERVRACYTREGRVDTATLDAGIELMAAELGVTERRPTESLYALAAC